MQKVVLIASVVVVVLFAVYQYDPTLFSRVMGYGAYEAFKNEDDHKENKVEPKKQGFQNHQGFQDHFENKDEPKKQGFQNQQGFEDQQKPKKQGFQDGEGFADLNAYQGPAQFGAADAPAGCYPRDQLTPSELLPKDMSTVWAEQNPMGPGSLKGKNFLSAGALIGVKTVGQSMRNANLQVRSEPPNPQVAVSIFNQSTISPDVSHRPLEIGS